METYLEVLLELVFCTKPPNFGVEAYMEVPTGVALKSVKLRQSHRFTFHPPPPRLHPSRAFTPRVLYSNPAHPPRRAIRSPITARPPQPPPSAFASTSHPLKP
jgi:hypothetical protein